MDRLIETLSAVELNGVGDFLRLGGPVVAVLLALSVMLSAVVLAKLAEFALAGVGWHRRARAAVRLYRSGDSAGARARARPRGPLAEAVVRYAIDAAGARDAATSRDATETVALLRLHRLRRMTGLIDIIAQIAPLLGLFGTVLGMIEAFRALEGQGASVDPSVLAGGIWVALLTTAVGLAVAMPAAVLSAWFDARLHSEEVAIDGLVTALFSGEAAPPVPTDARQGGVAGPSAATGKRRGALEQGAASRRRRGADRRAPPVGGAPAGPR